MSPETQLWLRESLATIEGTAGTVHVVEGRNLTLKAAHNIPPQVMARVRQLPRGKGMAGQAWLLDEPVQTCNLQTETHASIQPGAREVSAQGAIALPVHDSTGQIRAVVGFAFHEEKSLQKADLMRLIELAEALP